MNIIYSKIAQRDVGRLFYAITEDYQSPLTAARYVQGIYDEINKLSTQAKIHKIEYGAFYRQFGTIVRRINYKKMAIIYSVIENYVPESFVWIHRVIPASLVIE
ncbi:MAG: hypothetical protein FWC39_08415 [Bacteroidetes bacterium]|nr:hypothetical protein [Bacteroidota bacterium]